MPPTIILIRHGEAEHNHTGDHTLRDPPLTATGEAQCRQLHEHLRKDFPLANDVEVIITSPMIRAMQTTSIALDWLIERGVPVLASAQWQENSDKPCDTGSIPSTLKPKFPFVDFTDIDPIYPDKSASTRYAYTRTKILARGQACLSELYARPERLVAVVGHSAFLRTAVSQRRYANADFRVFTFDSETKPGSLRLVEAEETAGEGGMGWSQPGVAELRQGELPEGEQMEEVKERQGEKVDGEATAEVPQAG
ncbi:hypothetical protein ANO11243_072130 [Dothideomycetidae sp. 11243]|nr:hypothetical protein ANO11243_072130 [fungal sp. No.11243]